MIQKKKKRSLLAPKILAVCLGTSKSEAFITAAPSNREEVPAETLGANKQRKQNSKRNGVACGN
jgi:hypothetical protein